MKKLIALAILFIFISGCANQSQQARTEGTAGGAVMGGLLGGLLGYAIGDESGALAGAAIGGVLGGVAGYSYADNIAKRHEELAGRENDLDARISFAEGINQDTQEYNQQLEREIATLIPEVDALIVQARQEQITQQQLEEKRQSLDQKVRKTEAALASAQEDLEDLKIFRANALQERNSHEMDELDTEIAKLENNLEQLKENINTLASLSQRL